MESKKYRLNKEDFQKILKGMAIAIGGAIVTYFAEIIGQVDFGTWTPVAVAIASILINAARKFLKGI